MQVDPRHAPNRRILGLRDRRPGASWSTRALRGIDVLNRRFLRVSAPSQPLSATFGLRIAPWVMTTLATMAKVSRHLIRADWRSSDSSEGLATLAEVVRGRCATLRYVSVIEPDVLRTIVAPPVHYDSGRRKMKPGSSKGSQPGAEVGINTACARHRAAGIP